MLRGLLQGMAFLYVFSLYVKDELVCRSILLNNDKSFVC